MKILLSGITALGLLAFFVFAATAQDASTPYKAARKAEAARDFKAALAEYEKALDVDVEYKDTLKRWEACQDLAGWQKDLKGKPGAMDLVKLGEIYCKYKRYNSEREAYQEAIGLDPGCTDAHGHLAMSKLHEPRGRHAHRDRAHDALPRDKPEPGAHEEGAGRLGGLRPAAHLPDRDEEGTPGCGPGQE